MIWVIFLLPALTFAQLDIFGYYESENDYLQLQNADYNPGYNKLRLDFLSRSSDHVMIAGNINFQLRHGNRYFNFLEIIPFHISDHGREEFEQNNSVSLSDIMWGAINTIYLADTLFLDNIFLYSSFSKFDFTIGRQPLSLGTGYAWNPLDIFNRKELMDPTYEQTGINAIRLEIPLQDRTSMDAIMTPDSTWKKSAKMIQINMGIGSFDISLNGAYQHHLAPNTEIGYTYDQVYSAGGAFVGELWELGLWGETLWPLDIDDNFGEVVLGTDYTLNNGLYLMCEYFHNSSGAQVDSLNFGHYINYYSGVSHSLMQNYIFAMGMYNVTEFIVSSMAVFGNLDDNSYILAPQIDWEAFEDVTVGAWVSQSIGDEDTEFGIQNRAVRFRIRAYF